MKRCKRCNTELSKSSRFCPRCGFKVPDNSWITILLIVFGSIGITFVLIFAVVFLFVKSTLNKYTEAKYVELDKYNVPNFFYESDYSVCNFNIRQEGLSDNKQIAKQFRSCDNIKSKDIENYADLLLDDGFFIEDDFDTTYYVKEVSNNFIIVVYFYNRDTVVYVYKEDAVDYFKENKNVSI